MLTQMTRITFMLLMVLATVSHAGKYNAILSIGDVMPEFNKLPSTDGKLLSSKEIHESVVVLVSLANHCPWVKGMDQDLMKLAKSVSGKDVRVIGFAVNRSEDDRLPAMQVHAKKVGYTFSYLYDDSQQLGRLLGATRTPEYFVFNKDRKLVYMGLLYNSPAKMDPGGSVKHINGEPSEFYVQDAINNTLAGKAVKTPETRAHGCSVKYAN